MQVEVRYLLPHMREGGTLENIARERPNAAKVTTPQRIFAQTNPLTQPGAYEGGFLFNGGSGGDHVAAFRSEWQQVPQQPFGQLTPIPDLGAIKEAVHELYELGLRQISRSEFYKPYLEMIDREIPYPRGYRILDFSLFFGKYG